MDSALKFAIALGLAAIFLQSLAHKARDRRRFEAILADYKVVPGWSTAAAGAGIVTLEAIGSVAIMVPDYRSIGALVILGLLATYIGVIVVNLLRGRKNIDCGCSGPAARQNLSWWLVSRNVVLTILALLCILPDSDRTLLPVDFLTIGGGATAIFVAYQSVDHLLASWPRVVELRGE